MHIIILLQLVNAKTGGKLFDGFVVDETLFDERNSMNRRNGNRYLFTKNGKHECSKIGGNYNIRCVDGKNGDKNGHKKSDGVEVGTRRDIPCRTIKAVRWLYSKRRLSHKGKKQILSEIISNVDSPKFSKAEMAFSVFICGGRPSIELITVPGASYNVDDLDFQDMDEFADVCHAIYEE